VLRWPARYCREAKVTFEEAQAVLAALALLAGERKRNAAYALAELSVGVGSSVPARHLSPGFSRFYGGLGS
jgi:hypothetical protein